MASDVVYDIRAEDGRAWQFRFDVDAPAPSKGALPVWTELSFHQCSRCPLAPSPGARCPSAAQLAPVLEVFSQLQSFDQLDVTVRTRQRDYQKRASSQDVVRSILGLVMASSGCPVTSSLRPLARMHLPFSSVEETLFRSVSLHVTRAFLAGENPDRAALAALYADLLALNQDFTNRVRAFAEKDANPNGLVQLFSISVLVAQELDEDLEALRALLAP